MPTTIIHPVSLEQPGPPGSTFVEWRSDQDVVIGSRTYDFIVDREAQIWWPGHDHESGYRGYWGPLVAKDRVRRRRGMKFPEFHSMFFVALGKLAPPDYP